MSKDFPGGPVVKTWPSIAGGAALIFAQGTKIPLVSGSKKPKHKKKKKKNRSNIVTNLIKT